MVKAVVTENLDVNFFNIYVLHNSSWSQPVRRHTGRRRLQKRYTGTSTVDRSTDGMPGALAARRLRLAQNTLEIPGFPRILLSVKNTRSST